MAIDVQLTTLAPGNGPLAVLEADTSVPLTELTLGGMLADRAAAHPDRLALVGVDCAGAEVRLSYAALLDQARRVAVALLRLADPGEHVALWAPNLVEWPVIEYGAAIAGVVLVAINPQFRDVELEHVLRDSGAVVLLHADRSRDYDLSAVVAVVAPRSPELRHVVPLTERDRWMAADADDLDQVVFGPQAADPMAPVMLQYTSGTTGRPKGVLLRHRSLLNNAKLTLEGLHAPDGLIGVNPLPMFHTAGCVIATLGTHWCGGTEVLVSRFDPITVLDLLEQERANVLYFVPTVLGALIEAARARPAVRQLDLVLGGASVLPASMVAASRRTFGARATNLYGQTELSPVATMVRPDDPEEAASGTVGRPLPHTAVQIVDVLSRETVQRGVDGEICVRGYSAMIEYFGMPDATRATVDSDGWLRTGDIGHLDDDGRLVLTDRLKDMIIRGGDNVAPAEIEARLVEHPAVLQAAVVGVPDERWGEVVAAVLVLREPPADGLRQDLEAFARRTLSPFKAPSLWYVATEFPMTASGKVQKPRLREQLAARVHAALD